MDKDEVLALAKEAGGFKSFRESIAFYPDALVRFAALLAAKQQPRWKPRPMASVPHPNDISKRVVGFVVDNNGADMPSVQLEAILAAPCSSAAGSGAGAKAVELGQ
ncbi:MAG TPA: hypothetical protein VGU61_20010 [Noviherbaspirillum sp.]|uniref:hypothetical protein n=1 Tax=Noviherbaspirillum sp. TaxID=1926288 RepID=UPI002DDD80C8|nr:hypothetical protein [Noviherbaspirillum sp.]HEV2612558.1 hypothetical protein [Noviherbaspirillum sp.]